MFPPASLGKVVDFPRRHSSSRAFTLIEMLTVVAIIGIATAMLLPAFNGLQKSGLLTNGGNTVLNLASLARQDAISKNTLTALVALGSVGTEDDHRALCVMEYNPVNGWAISRNWEKLPNGIIIDYTDSANCTFYQNLPFQFPFVNKNGQANPPFTYHGQTVSADIGCAARVFLPNGSLQNPEENAQIRVVQGVANGKSINYTNKGGTAAAVNFYDILILGSTGTAKALRP